MKKILASLLAVAICLSLITGCGSTNNNNNTGSSKNSGKLSCNKVETDDDGYKTTDELIVTYKDDKVIKVEDTNIAETDSDYIDFTLSFGQLFAQAFNQIDGMQVEYSKVDDDKIKYVMSVDYTILDVEALNDLISDMDTSSESTNDLFYSQKDISINDFRSNYLNEYTCE
jgi:hypothetical protein